MKKTIQSILLQGVCILILSGCSSNLLNGKESSNSKNTEISGQKPSSVIEFDQKLAKISSKETAEDAINHFAVHVVENTYNFKYSVKDTQPSAQALTGSNFSHDLIEAFAVAELAKRTSGIGTLSEEGLVTPQKLAEMINKIEPETTAPEDRVTSQDIQANQEIIRQQLPHINTSETPLMTPLEASVITYYILTGDEGNGTNSGQELHATPKQIADFATDLVKN